MNQKKTFTLLLLTILALLFVACGGTEPQPAEPTQPPAAEEPVDEPQPTEEEPSAQEEASGEPVTITYFTFSAAPDHLGDLDQMIAAFEAEHPDVNVEVETAPFDDYFTRLQALIAGDAAPDVFELNYESFPGYAARGALLDLTPLAQADEAFSADIFYPRAYDAFKYQDQQMALPAHFSTVVLYYNKDLFDAAGVDYPAADWTWDDAVAAAREITDPDAGVWGLFSPVQFWEFYKKAAQNNCQFFDEQQTAATIDEPACVEALEKMISFEEQGVMPTTADLAGMSGDDLFAAGQLGMTVTGIWQYAAFADAPFAWDIQVEPGMAQKATHFFANGVAASAGTPNPDAAWQWIQFYASSPEMAQIRVDTGWELPTLTNEEFVSGYLEQSPPDNREAVFESLNYAITPPVIERQNEMQDGVNQLIEQVALGQLQPEEALQQARALIEDLLAE